MELPLVKVPDWRRDVAEGEEELLLAAAMETVYLLELSHILQVGLELPVKRATPFGPNMEQKEYSFWSQNRAKVGVVEQPVSVYKHHNDTVFVFSIQSRASSVPEIVVPESRLSSSFQNSTICALRVFHNYFLSPHLWNQPRLVSFRLIKSSLQFPEDLFSLQ